MWSVEVGPGRKVDIMQSNHRVEKPLEKTGCRLVLALVVVVYSSSLTESCTTQEGVKCKIFSFKPLQQTVTVSKMFMSRQSAGLRL